ncbi:MAG: MATE family efflux transporter [Lentisphaeria bacterium]|nr:MATE family efflux transporter [Lentisphaeria bacterium]
MQKKRFTIDGDFKKFIRYSLPSTIGMLISGIYTLVDGLFVGWGVGPDGLAAINVAFPFYCIYLGLGEMLGNGCAITIAYCRGRNKKLTGGLFFGNMLFMLLPLGILLAVLAPIAAVQVKYMGADPEINAMAYGYALIISCFAIFQIATSSLLAVMRHDRKPVVAMAMMLSGLLANIVLDYYFVLVLHWGVNGSAYATILSQVLTCLLGAVYLKFGRLNFTWRRRFLRPYGDIVGQIFTIGLPSMGLQLMGGLLILLHNIQAQRYGGLNAVAAYAIISYITSPVLLLADGISLGIQPPVSYYHGRGEFIRKRRFLFYGTWAILGLTFLAGVIAISADKILPLIFNATGGVAKLTTTGLLLSALSFPALGVFQLLVAYYQAEGRSWVSALLIYSDCLVALPLVLFTMPLFLGLNGVWAALAVSKLIMMCVALYFRKALPSPEIAVETT